MTTETSGAQSRRMQAELKAPVTDRDWAAYHAIRRRVLFELRVCLRALPELNDAASPARRVGRGFVRPLPAIKGS
jgi:hypothetical protein